MLVDGLSTVDYFGSDLWQMLGKSCELFLDLIGELSSVTEDQCRYRFGVLRQLMKNCENEHCSLAHARLGLAQDIYTDHGIRDAFLLNFRRMFKSAIHNGSLQLGLE